MKITSMISILSLAILLSPSFAFMAELSDCTEETVSCICTPSGPQIDSDKVANINDCENQCTIKWIDDNDITGYSMQCSISGTLTTIAQGDLEDLTEAFAEASYYYDDPTLSVEIPGLEFTPAYKEGDAAVSNYLGEYIEAVYNWIIPAAALIAIIMLMIGGLQWMLARGDSGKIGNAKQRLKNAVVGLILLLGAYSITYFIDPGLLTFDTLEISYVEQELYSFPPYGEDLNITPRDDISGDVTDIGGDHIEVQTSESALNPDAQQALNMAAADFYAATGGSLRITSGYRTVEKQQALYDQNCSSGSCSPPTCNPGSPPAISNCPHTSSIALDTWYSGGPGNYQADPALMQKVAEAMIANGFCRLGAEVWHFELDAKHVSSSCSTSNIAPSYTTGGKTYTPTSGCGLWDFKNHKCVQ